MIVLLLTLAVVAGFGAWYVRRRRLEASATWAQARLVTDPVLDALYAKVVRRIAAVRPEAVIAPERTVALRVHPGPFPRPNSTGWGKVLVAGVLDPTGTVVVRADHRHDAHLWAHEFAHAITGIPDHPDWLYAADGFSLNV